MQRAMASMASAADYPAAQHLETGEQIPACQTPVRALMHMWVDTL